MGKKDFSSVCACVLVGAFQKNQLLLFTLPRVTRCFTYIDLFVRSATISALTAACRFSTLGQGHSDNGMYTENDKVKKKKSGISVEVH